MKSVKGYIQRKTMLYETGVEYGDYTMNHVLGCAHGCKFPCYAFMMKKLKHIIIFNLTNFVMIYQENMIKCYALIFAG